MIETMVFVVIWLVMGGWAFSNLDHGRHILAGFAWCVLFAPFAFGAAIGERGKE